MNENQNPDSPAGGSAIAIAGDVRVGELRPHGEGVKAVRASVMDLRTQLVAAGVAERKADELIAPGLAAAEKCESLVVEVWRPFGGAVSFAEIDSYTEANDRAWQIEDLSIKFNYLVENIMGLSAEEVTLAEKASKVADAAGDLQTRVGQIEVGQKDRGMLGKVTDALKRAVKGDAPQQGLQLGTEFGAIRAFKDASGTQRWMGVWSNAWKDNAGEVFTEAAHREFLEFCDKSGHMPELWLWHTPGSRVGIADTLDMHDGFMIASGVFDAGKEYIAANIKSDDAMSHGYFYPLAQKQNGKFSQYRTYELSILPGARAGNSLTAFVPVQEAITMDGAKEKYLREKMGDEAVDGLISTLSTVRTQMKERGVEYSVKELAEAFDTPAAPTVAAPPTPADPAAAGVQASAPPPASEPVVAAVAVASDDKALATIGNAIAMAVKEATDPIAEAIKGVNTTLGEHREMLTALKEADDTKIAAAFAPRATAVASAVKAGEGDDKPPPMVAAAAEAVDKVPELAAMGPVGPYLEQLTRMPLAVGG